MPGAALLLAGCEGALSMIDPAGPAARDIATLWWVMLGGATVIYLIVMALLVLAFRNGHDSTSERVWLWGLGLAFPGAVLAGLLAYGLLIGEVLLPRDGADAVSVTAEAAQWHWTFGYADAPGRTTQDVLHLPAGQPVDVAITTSDVIHSFWVPRLAGKLDAVPGHVNVLRIQADTPGSFEGVSAEYSGTGYFAHRFTVIAHDADGWARFLAGESP